MPTSRSAVGYRWDWTNYVVHPDASFQLAYREQWRFYLLEFERRATTPRRVRTRLENYRRYFNSGWPNRDHGGLPPLVLFVFPNPDAEDNFLRAAGGSTDPSCSPPTSRPWVNVGYWKLMATAASSPCRTETPGPQLHCCKMTNSVYGLPVGGVSTKLGHLLPTLSGPKRPNRCQLVAKTTTRRHRPPWERRPWTYRRHIPDVFDVSGMTPC